MARRTWDSSIHRRGGRLGRRFSQNARRRQPSAGVPRHRRQAPALRLSGRQPGVQVRGPQDVRILPRPAQAQRPHRRRRGGGDSAPGQQTHHQRRPPTGWESRRRRSWSTSTVTETRSPPLSRWPRATPSGRAGSTRAISCYSPPWGLAIPWAPASGAGRTEAGGPGARDQGQGPGARDRGPGAGGQGQGPGAGARGRGPGARGPGAGAGGQGAGGRGRGPGAGGLGATGARAGAGGRGPGPGAGAGAGGRGPGARGPGGRGHRRLN